MLSQDILPRAVSRLLHLPLLLFPLIGIALGCDSARPLNGARATKSEHRAVYSLGRIEPAGGIISISAMPGERLKALHSELAENERTPASGVLGILNSYDLGRVQLAALVKNREIAQESQLHRIEVAEAQQAQAEAALAQAVAQQTEVDLQYKKLRALQSASQLAADELTQLESLRTRDPELVTPNQLQRQRNELEMAQAEYTIANESYASAREAAEKAVQSAQASLRLAELSVEQAVQGFEVQSIDQEIKVARENLKRSVLLAPNVSRMEQEELMQMADELIAGESTEGEPGPYSVLRILLRPGEFISQTPILQIADLSDLVCVAEVYEADVQELRVGQLAKIRSPAFRAPFEEEEDPETGRRVGGIQARVERIGSVVGSPGIMPRNPLAPADRNVVEVRLAIENPEAIELLSRQIGLQVTVEFEPQAATETE